MRIQYMPLKLITEMPNCRRYWPCRSITQWTNCISFYLALYIPKQVYIIHGTMTMFYLVQYPYHPSSTFATSRTLSTAIIEIESSKSPRIAYNTLIFIIHDKTARTQHRACLKTTISE